MGKSGVTIAPRRQSVEIASICRLCVMSDTLRSSSLFIASEQTASCSSRLSRPDMCVKYSCIPSSEKVRISHPISWKRSSFSTSMRCIMYSRTIRV